jgi:glycosyltransferase involved in cell wall biosynthesis
MSPTPDPISDGAEGPGFAIEPVMARVRLKVLERLGWNAEHDRGAYEQVKAAFQAAREALNPGTPFYPQILGREEDWEVPMPLVFESHRGWMGRIIILFKKRILFPLNRWLHSYVWHNLRRQQEVNLLLLSAVESLAVAHGRLRQEMENRYPPPAGAASLLVSPPRSGAAPPPEDVRTMRLAFVVDRYGPEVPGGSERHCREFTRRLAQRGHEVTVLTSCARDYVSWENHYPPGPEKDGAATVVRFPVASPRDPAAWRDLSRRVFSGLGSDEDERRWFRESGPHVPSLLEYLRDHRESFDLFIFFSYRYYPTFAGLPLVASRAILVPTAEEDPAIRLAVLRQFFTLPLGIIHNTAEEHQLLRSLSGATFPAFAIIGSGVAEAGAAPDAGVLERLGVRPPFILCLGRVDPNKGSAALLAHFRRYVELEGEKIQLVLAGQPVMEVPSQPGVRVLGHVSEEERSALLHHMHVLVAPSPFESLSLALLEAWMHGRPALVNGWCKVLRGQVARAGGGLYYDNAAEFREALRLLIEEPELADRLGRQGREHARREYAWPVVMERLERFLRERLPAAAPGRESSGRP